MANPMCNLKPPSAFDPPDSRSQETSMKNQATICTFRASRGVSSFNLTGNKRKAPAASLSSRSTVIPSSPVLSPLEPKKKRPSRASVISSSSNSISSSRRSSTSLAERPCVSHDYHDHASDKDHSFKSTGQFSSSDEDVDMQELVTRRRKGPRGGVAVPFPEKLHAMLDSVEEKGLSHIVSWQPHGRCFLVHDPKKFVTDIMPRYFKQSKLTSFQRQLNLYGFCRLTSGRDRGGYYHELFLKNKPFLCKRIMRTRIKGTGIKAANNPSKEPDFYGMPWVGAPHEEVSNVKPPPADNTVLSFEDVPEDVTAALVRRFSDTVEDEPQLLSSDRFLEIPSLPTILPSPELVTSSARKTFELPSAPVTPPGSPPQSSRAPYHTEFPASMRLQDTTGDDDDETFHANDEILFEGKMFHYLDSTSFDILDRVYADGFDLEYSTTTLSSPVKITVDTERMELSCFDRRENSKGALAA